MKENERIIKLFEDLYNGHPWIDVSLLPNLKKLTAKQAAKRIYADWNTIWEIVNHTISWRETVLLRIQGKVIKSPAHNYFVPLKDTSEEAWRNTLAQLELTQQLWIAFLKNFNEADFEKIYRANKLTYYEHIHGILHHDAYHLGQIVIMMKRVMK